MQAVALDDKCNDSVPSQRTLARSGFNVCRMGGGCTVYIKL